MITRLGEYAHQGDYHEQVDPNWKYLPVYLAKKERVERFMRDCAGAKILDLGCGEGVMVKAYRHQGYDIIGMDLHYESDYVIHGDMLATGYPDASFDVILCLDVVEHLNFAEQELALKEIARILKPGGRLLLTVPNLAHLASRLKFLILGELVRTSIIERHPGDRPLGEYRQMLQKDFQIMKLEGLFPTFPFISLVTWLKPSLSVPLHRIYNHLLARPGWCFLGVFVCEKKITGQAK